MGRRVASGKRSRRLTDDRHRCSAGSTIFRSGPVLVMLACRCGACCVSGGWTQPGAAIGRRRRPFPALRFAPVTSAGARRRRRYRLLNAPAVTDTRNGEPAGAVPTVRPRDARSLRVVVAPQRNGDRGRRAQVGGPVAAEPKVRFRLETEPSGDSVAGLALRHQAPSSIIITSVAALLRSAISGWYSGA
jgi:hypothetical protein